MARGMGGVRCRRRWAVATASAQVRLDGAPTLRIIPSGPVNDRVVIQGYRTQIPVGLRKRWHAPPMPELVVSLHHFPAQPGEVHLNVTPADLVRAAIAVGRPPLAVSAGGSPVLPALPRRAYLSLVWRALIVRTHLASRGHDWVRSESYKSLDSSEKSAVSYFLGNTQAKLTSEMVLGVPHLVHVDTVLHALGRPRRKSRPDFIGCDASGHALPVAIEAKGRTWGYTDELVARSKGQARLLPAITGLPNPVAVSSIAWFDGDVWRARLEDPPSQRGGIELSAGVVVAGAYLAFAEAMQEAEQEVDEGIVTARFPEADLKIKAPEALVSTELKASVFETSVAKGADFEWIVAERAARSVAQESSRRRHADPESQAWTSYGRDGVEVVLGETWRAAFAAGTASAQS